MAPCFEDMLVGFAIGDAFGAGVEFQDRDWIKANVDFTTFVNARHLLDEKQNTTLFTQNYKAWNYSDDTEMTIGLIKAICSGKAFTPDLLVQYWLEEYQAGIAINGFGRNGHGSMAWFFEGKNSIDEIRDFQRNRPYPGNAPAMRAMPLGFMPEHLINPYAIINANATHPHPKAQAASIVVARATAFLMVQQGNVQQLISYCINHIQDLDFDTAELLRSIDKLPPPDELSDDDHAILCGPQPIEAPRFLPGIKGLPSDAMLTGGAILYILKHAKSAFEGLKNAIYLGGDVDTIASVCCGILSGLHGLGSLPPFMAQQVEGVPYLTAVANKFHQFQQDLALGTGNK